MLAAPPPPTARQHFEAVALALLCAVLFLGSALLPGRALVPHPPEQLDVVMAEAHAAGTFDAADAFRGSVAMRDKYLQSLCWDRVLQDRLRAGELPRWTNDIGGGAPFVPQMAQPWQPINLLLLVLPSEQWYGWWYLVHQVLFGVFAWRFLWRLGCTHGAALLGLVAAVLGLWTQCKLGHNVILTAALSVWPMLAAAHELVAVGARGAARTFAVGWLGLWSGLAWSTGFVPIALQATYLTGALGLLFVASAPAGERLRRLVPLGLGLGLGALVCAANMLPILLASAESARAGKWSTEVLATSGLEWDHLLGFFWPDLLAWPAEHFYVPPGEGPPLATATGMPWSQLVLLAQPLREGTAHHSWVETACGIGLLPMAAAAAAFGDRARRGLVLGLGAVGLFAFGLATAQRPFLPLSQVLPGLGAGDLRRLLFTTVIAAIVLGALGSDVLLRGARRVVLAGGLAAIAAASLAALLWLGQHNDAPSFVQGTAELIAADTDHPQVVALGGNAATIAAAIGGAAKPGEAEHNQAMQTATAVRALVVAALALVSLALRLRWRAPVWIALTIAELLHAGHGAVVTVPAERVTRMPAVLGPLAAATAAAPNGDRPRLCRLAAPGASPDTLWPPNLAGFLRLEDSSAYNPLPPARYEQFVAAIDPSAVLGGAGVTAFHDARVLTHPLCDLYGMRFLLTREPVPEIASLADVTPPGTGPFKLYERTTTLPRATFVQHVDILADRSARLAALGAVDRDVAHRVVLEDPDAPRVDASRPANATATIVERVDERVVVRVRTEAAGYLRLADPWDAGWRATLDGVAAPIFVADHYLRAVHVPAGEHEVVFTYDGARATWPLRLSLLGYAIVAWLLWRGRRRA